MDASALIQGAQPGDRVTIRTPHGQERSGKVVLRYPSHLVLNGGGRHGTPLVATPANIVKVRPARRAA